MSEMVKIAFGYGTTVQNVEVPEENLLGVLTANPVCTPPGEEEEIRRALREPIGSKPLSEIVNPGEKIAIVTSDITRPMPTHAVLPLLLDELFRCGVKPGDIILVFALGSHRKHSEEEKRKLVGDCIYESIRCIDGDTEDCVHLGVTAGGTPVDIVRTVAEADRRICLGNIEYHYFAGYSGGAKAIMPGVSTKAAIQSNHSRMVDPKACAGNLEDNPLRRDIEEAAAICGVDFILNVVLDEHKKVIKAFAGDAVAAHRCGCAFLDTLYQKKIDRRADIVLVSQGGAPKDLNLYQTQKALDNAKHAVKDGGTIILIGACREGLGDEVFQEWMLSAGEPKQLISRVGEHFELGGHKAAAIAMVLEHADIFLVSELAPDFVRKLFLVPFQTARDALDAAFRKAGRQARVLAMPHGGSTLPKVVPFTENGGK